MRVFCNSRNDFHLEKTEQDAPFHGIAHMTILVLTGMVFVII